MSNTETETDKFEESARTPKGIIHLSLQGKGGVGKSLVASIIAQYYAHRGRKRNALTPTR